MSIINAVPLLAAAGGDYQISRSVRLRSSASAYLNRTLSASSRTTWTWSGWAKRGTLGGASSQDLFEGGTDSSNWDYMRFTTSDALQILSAVAGTANLQLVTTQVFRDPSAWYHIVLVYDTTQATAANRVKLYVNGVQVTAFSTATYPAQNYTGWIGSANAHRMGANVVASPGEFFDGYLTEVNFIDGQALTPSSFGENDSITGVWKPKKYGGTYGTNGFYLNFSDNSAATAAAIGKDSSGNGNNWTPNNISVTAGVTYDSMLDVPTLYADGGNGRGNYATLNPVANSSTLINGNLTTNAGDKWSISTIGMSSGQWYCEVTVTTVGTESSMGISTQPYSGIASIVGNGTATAWGYLSTNGNKYNNGVSTAYGATFTSGDVIGIAFDADAGTLTFYKNNTSQGTAFTGLTSGPYFFALEGRTSGSANNCSINFGQRPFSYTPPTGFKALNTQNLPDATIQKGNKFFDVVTRNGFGASGGTVSSLNFQPDLFWSKARSSVSDHNVVDAVRGVSKTLYTDLTSAEASTPNFVTSFNSNGYTVGSSDWSTGATVAEWLWNAGNVTVSNTAGSITSSVRANPTAGISVVTYTGTGANATVGHGLGVAPKMMIIKQRNSTNGWAVYHASLGATQYAILNLTAAAAASAVLWNNTAPTSSVLTVSTDASVNASASTYVAYCFAEVAGFSKFGSYTGNGSADGPFVFCGFRPRFVMIKRTDTTSNWIIKDTARADSNVALTALYPNLSNSEGSGDDYDILSNGFKLRLSTSTNTNASGGTYIFAAFAEVPFRSALAR